MKWVPFDLLSFFPLFYSIFCFKIGHFSFKTQCFGSLKNPFSGPKRTNGGFGVPRPQHGLASNWQKLQKKKKREKGQRDKWYLFRAPTCTPPGIFKKIQPPPLLVAPDSPYPSPEQKKKIRNVRQVLNSKIALKERLFSELTGSDLVSSWVRTEENLVNSIFCCFSRKYQQIGPKTQKTREGCGCLRFLAGKVFGQILTLLENSSPIFRQHEMLSLPRFGHFPARKSAARKLAVPSGTLLDFLL